MEYISPGGDLDYLIDFTDYLADGETIATVDLTVETGLTVDSQINSDTGTTIRVIADSDYTGKALRIIAQGTSNVPNIFRRSIFFKIQDQLA